MLAGGEVASKSAYTAAASKSAYTAVASKSAYTGAAVYGVSGVAVVAWLQCSAVEHCSSLAGGCTA